MNELVPISGGAIATVSPLPVADIELTAESGDEMQQCQAALIKWAEKKVKEAAAQHRELKEAFEHAVKRKWKSGTLRRHAGFALKRFAFYHKFLKALRYGYQIVPSFPVTLFAIRTAKKHVKAYYSTNNPWYNNREQEAQTLQQGEGSYKNPFPLIRQKATKTPEGEEVTTYWADGWDEFEFPLSMAKPQIMKAASRAMALKIFDEIGICPPDPKKQDPMIIGSILFPPKYQHDTARKVSFIIAWHLNTATI